MNEDFAVLRELVEFENRSPYTEALSGIEAALEISDDLQEQLRTAQRHILGLCDEIGITPEEVAGFLGEQ